MPILKTMSPIALVAGELLSDPPGAEQIAALRQRYPQAHSAKARSR